MYQLKLRQFEGPFDLLLQLIDKKKLSINEVSLAEVADQYVNYLKQIARFPVAEVASFVVVAATLMLIKSRSLIPTLELSREEEAEIGDLEERLKIYKVYYALSKSLEKIFGKKVIFAREGFLQIESIFVESEDLSLKNIASALEKIISNLPTKELALPEALVKKTVTLEQKIDQLIKRIENKISLYFSDLNLRQSEKVEIIVTFLALLELTKRGFIIVKQDKVFGEIEINKK